MFKLRPKLTVRHLALIFCFSTVLVYGGSAISEENSFVSLEQALINGAEPSYFPIRCAALYASMAKWAGEEQLGSESYSGLLGNAENLVSLSAKIRSEANVNTFELAKQSAYGDLVVIGNIYIGRYKENYSRTGQAWESDELWKSDLTFCSTMGNIE